MTPLSQDKMASIESGRGSCFFCSKQTVLKNSWECHENSSVLPLLRFLKLNSDNFLHSQISATIDEEFKLKTEVELCEECLKITSKVSQVVFKLELLQMEAVYYLDLVRKRISERREITQNSSKMELRTRKNNENGIEHGSTKIEVDFRSIILQRCSKFIDKAQPRLLIKRVDTEKQSDSGKDNDDDLASSPTIHTEDLQTEKHHQNIDDENCVEESDRSEQLTTIEKKLFSRPIVVDTVDLYQQDLLDKQIKAESKAQSELPTMAIDLQPHPFENGATLESSVSQEDVFLEQSPIPEIISAENVSVPDNCDFFPQLRNKQPIIGCKMCGKEFRTQFSLDRHVERIHDTPSLECTHCSRTFSGVASKHYEKHVRKCSISSLKVKRGVHPEDDKLTCRICRKKFSREQNLSRHCKHVHEGIRNHACNVCDKSFHERWQLTNHYRSVHLQIQYSCNFPSCTRKFRNKGRLAQHRKLFHPAPPDSNGTKSKSNGKSRRDKILRGEASVCSNTVKEITIHGDTDDEVVEMFPIIAQKYKKEDEEEHNVAQTEISNFRNDGIDIGSTTNKVFPSKPFRRYSSRHTRKAQIKAREFNFVAYDDHGKGVPNILRKRPSACTICGKTFVHSMALRQHHQTIHKDMDVPSPHPKPVPSQSIPLPDNDSDSDVMIIE